MNAPATIPRAKTIALAGNPNAGKTTLFNRDRPQAARKHPGVTVELLVGALTLPTGAARDRYPGTYARRALPE